MIEEIADTIEYSITNTMRTTLYCQDLSRLCYMNAAKAVLKLMETKDDR